MIDEELLDLARECVRRVVENDILAIRQMDSASMHAFWDLCSDAYEAVRGDDALRDRLWGMVGDELADVQINYLLKGETAKDGAIRRVRLDRERARLKVLHAESEFANLDAQLRALES